MGKGKFLKGVAAIAAIGGVCYVFRDKIKSSTVYQSLDMDEKVEKVKSTIKDKMPVKDEADRDYFSLDDETPAEEGADASDSEDTSEIESDDAASVSDDSPSDSDTDSVSEEAATVSESTSELTAKVDNLISDIPINQPDTSEADESPLLYENEGLSDVSEDPDVLEEQDKLDL